MEEAKELKASFELNSLQRASNLGALVKQGKIVLSFCTSRVRCLFTQIMIKSSNRSWDVWAMLESKGYGFPVVFYDKQDTTSVLVFLIFASDQLTQLGSIFVAMSVSPTWGIARPETHNHYRNMDGLCSDFIMIQNWHWIIFRYCKTKYIILY